MALKNATFEILALGFPYTSIMMIGTIAEVAGV
jgi:hypothetical protein